MELTINTFSKGLLLDTHPMVQSNDTLSDCINGTFITMNGNEMLLQNDMGNRRVDNAFLPSGYEPVGIKEYGGIIYIAAYNPITGRSQIGSFPSPERRISKVDDNDLGATVDFNQDFRLFGKGVKVDSRYNNILWLVTDTFLYPLSSKNSMHAGDKFVVYGFHNDKSFDLNKYITNYYNTRGDKVITPLNRKYTLSLGILNSQNEFADITSTLVRWQDDIRCEFDETVTDLFKFNKGYFLADGLPSNIGTFEDSINDTQFIQERKALTLAINTYAYKLIGPLYLKVVLNHIEQFNYNIYGVYDNGKGTLWVEGYLTYNCPHIVDSPNPINDEDYITFDDGVLTSMQSFDFYWIDDEVQFSSGKCVQDLNFDLINTTTFDKNTSMYSAKIVKKFNISRDGGRFRMEENDEIFDFFLGVCAPEITLNNEQIYLEGLSVFDSINLSLLGSGVVKIKGWRFYNSVDERNTSLTYLLNAYPRYKRKFINLEMLLWDASLLTSVPDISTVPDALVPLSEQIFNGRTTVKFEWPSTIEPRKLYYVALRYLILNIDNPNLYYTANDVECTTPIWIQLDTQGKLPWFLSTELFNSCYVAGKDDFISCYFNPITEEELASYNKKVAVDVVIDPGLVSPVESKKVGLTGRLIQDLKQPSVHTRRPIAGEGEETSAEEEALNSPFSIDTTTDIGYLYHPTIVIKNPELYPDYLTVDPQAVDNITYSKIYYYDKTDDTTDSLKYFVGILNSKIRYSAPYNDPPIKVIDITEDSNNEDRKFDFRIINRDVVYCERVSSPDIKIINAFDSIQHTLVGYLKETIKGAAALTPEFDARSGPDDGHFINFIHYEDFTKKVDYAWTKCEYARSAEFEVVDLSDKASKISDHITELYRQMADNEVIISFSSVELDFYDLMDTYFENLEFVFLFDYYNPEGLQGMTDSTERVSEIPQVLFSKGARVWWKTSFGKWVLLKDIYPNPMYNKSSSNAENNVTLDFTRWLSRFFVNDFVYCFIGEIGIDKCGLAVPIKESMIYTLPYSLDITISIILELSRLNYIINNATDKLCNQLIQFKLDKDIKYVDQHKVTISSNEDFKETISLDFTALRNIDIVTGKTRDVNNNLLSTASLYKRTDKGLEVYNSPYIEIKEATVNTDYNKVLYANLENFGNPKLRYDCDGGDGKHHWTLIDYKDVLVTPQVI